MRITQSVVALNLKQLKELLSSSKNDPLDYVITKIIKFHSVFLYTAVIFSPWIITRRRNFQNVSLHVPVWDHGKMECLVVKNFLCFAKKKRKVDEERKPSIFQWASAVEFNELSSRNVLSSHTYTRFTLRRAVSLFGDKEVIVVRWKDVVGE